MTVRSADCTRITLLFSFTDEAERIMSEERERLRLPKDMPTFSSIEAKRLSNEDT